MTGGSWPGYDPATTHLTPSEVYPSWHHIQNHCDSACEIMMKIGMAPEVMLFNEQFLLGKSPASS